MRLEDGKKKAFLMQPEQALSVKIGDKVNPWFIRRGSQRYNGSACSPQKCYSSLDVIWDGLERGCNLTVWSDSVDRHAQSESMEVSLLSGSQTFK